MFCALLGQDIRRAFTGPLVLWLWFTVACFLCQSFGDVSPYICSYYFNSVSMAELTTFWDIAAYSVYHMFYCSLTICNTSYFLFLF